MIKTISLLIIGYVIKDLHQGSSFVSDVGAWDIQDKPGGASGYTDCAGK